MTDVELAAELERLSRCATPVPWSICSGYQHKAYNRQGKDTNWVSWGIPEGDTSLIIFMRNNLDRIIERLRA